MHVSSSRWLPLASFIESDAKPKYPFFDKNKHFFRLNSCEENHIGLTNELSLQLNVDYGLEENGSGKGDGSSSNWWGYAVIARYDVNKWFSMNVRGEYLNDSDGFATGTVGTNVWEFTFTPEFRVHDNFVFRVEYRHDEASTPVFEDESGLTTNDTQDTIAMNALVYF